MTDSHDDDKQIKVTDKRMFTADGELRDEFKDLGKGAPKADPKTPETPPQAPASGQQPIVGPGGAGPAPADASKSTAPKPKDYPSGAQFEELVALLAQTTATFLQQATRPERRTENLDQAQLYFDLLEILQDRTRGNLLAREQAILDDAVRQLRMALAQHG